MSNLQIPLDQVHQLFNAYIKTFNQDYQTTVPHDQRQPHPISQNLTHQYQLLTQRIPIYRIPIDDQQPPIDMVNFASVVKCLTYQSQMLNQNKFYRFAITLNTIIGDLQTQLASHVICFGHDDRQYWLVEKEPAQNADGIYYYYDLTTEPISTPISQIFQNINYLMTDRDVNRLLTDEDSLDGFVSMDQQMTFISHAILTKADFNKFEL